MNPKTSESKPVAHPEPGDPVSFLSFIRQKQQRADWLLIGLICLLGYIVLKVYYPYPAAVSDSGGYVSAALKDQFNFYRPFGYSYFLQKVYLFSESIHAVFIVQLFLYAATTALFAFTVKYFFPPFHKLLWYAALALLVFSPLAFFMANSIMSDSLFASMIYIMLSMLVFIVKTPKWQPLVVLLLALFCSLHIRYSALAFPFVFIVVFIVATRGVFRFVSIIATLFVVTLFYSQTKSEMRGITGLNQFSTGFDGWQLANNALHVVPYIDLDPQSIEDEDVQTIHTFVSHYKDSIARHTENGTIATAAFLWDKNMPLKQYTFKTVMQSKLTYGTVWVNLGSGPYKNYGKYLIKNYPFAFFRYYLLPNSKSIFYPSNTGIMESYAGVQGKSDILRWYHLDPTRDQLNCRSDIYGNFLAGFVVASFIPMWIVTFAIAIIALLFAFRKQLTLQKFEKQVFWSIVLFGLIYYASTVFASPVETRYWLPMGCVQFAFCYILLNKLIALFRFRNTKAD